MTAVARARLRAVAVSPSVRVSRALHVAARRGLVDVTEALVGHGASVSCVDARGYTPALATTVSDAHADCLSLIMAASRSDRSPAPTTRLSSGSSYRLSETGETEFTPAQGCFSIFPLLVIVPDR